MTEQHSEPGGEAAWLGERCKVALELELAFAERGSETGEELAAEDTPSTLTGRKNVSREVIQLA